MQTGLVSIITPCYNGGKYIGETIESVIRQSYQDWEMIVVDDGSMDNSEVIVKEYKKKDDRIKLIQQEKKGSAAARNRGIRKASGQYIALLDADDLWEPEFLEKQIRYMKEKDAVCVFCSYRRINESSEEILHPIIAKGLITEKHMKVMNYIGCLTGLYDVSKYGKLYLKEELKSIRDDYAYWYDVVALEGKAYGNPEILARYRVTNMSVTANKQKLIKKQYQFYVKYLKENPIMAGIHVICWGISGIRKFT